MAHHTRAVMHAPPGTEPAQWRWRATCDECGPIGEAHTDVERDESYARAKVDQRVHETYPDGTVIMVGGAEVHLR